MADISSITLPGGGTYDLKDKNAVPKYGMGKNLLDNWYFMKSQTRGGQLPINRRAASTLSTTGAYFIDRWAIFDGAGSASLSSDGITLTGSTNFLRFGQQIPAWKIIGRQVTFSILVGSISSGGTVSFFMGLSIGNVVNNFGVDGIGVAETTTAGLVSVTGTPTLRSGQGTINDLANCLIRVSQGTTAVIKAVKVEYGSQQTLAHQENGVWVLNEIPDYDEELLKCETNKCATTDVYAQQTVSVNIPNRNLLDNWYFRGGGSQQGGGQFPINQRGQASYSINGIGIDRWKATVANIKVDVGSSGVIVTDQAGANHSGSFVWGQRIENPIALAGMIVTVSAYVITSGNMRLAIRLQNNSSLVAEVKSGELTTTGIHSFTYTMPSSGFNFMMVGLITGSGTTSCTLAALKFEIGRVQTLAYQVYNGWILNEIPNYTEELLKCQRHCVVINPYGEAMQIGLGTATATTEVRVPFRFPVQMRGVPTLESSSGTFVLSQGPSATAVTSVTITTGTHENCSLIFYGANLVLNAVYAAVTPTTTPGKIVLSADL